MQPARHSPILFTLVPALAVALMLAACSRPEPPKPPGVPEVAVRTALVESRKVPQVSEFVAGTAAIQTVDVRARVEGVLEQAFFQEGAQVRKGQLLFQIDPRQYAANLDSAKADLAKAQAEFVRASKDVERLRPLAREEAVPQRDLDVAVASEGAARAALDAARSRITRAQLDVEYAGIRSPLDGVVGRLNVNVGNFVGRGDAVLLTTISSVNPMYVDFSVAEADYLAYRRESGEKLPKTFELILADGSVYPYPGRFQSVGRAVDPKTGALPIRLEFPNPKGMLRPGQFGKVRVKIAEPRESVLVPQRAVSEVQSLKVAYVVGADGAASMRKLTLGGGADGFWTVLDGLKPGEKVVVEGHQKLRAGVKVVEAPPPAAPGNPPASR